MKYCVLIGAAGTLLSLSTAMPAQSLVGWSKYSVAGGTGYVQRQDAGFGPCAKAEDLGPSLECKDLLGAGGTAYDARHQAAWVSDGIQIELFRLEDKRVLSSFKAELLTKEAHVTGLAISLSRKLLFQMEMAPDQIMGITTYDISAIPPVKLPGSKASTLGIPGEQAGGIAYDEGRDLLYYATNWRGLIGPENSLYYTERKNPIHDPDKALPISLCTRGAPIMGLAFSSASSQLYVATATEYNILAVRDPLQGDVLSLNQVLKLPCCQKQLSQGWAGLGLIPNSSSQTVGSSCLGQGCTSCAMMKLDLAGGDPVIGNPDLALAIDRGPAGAVGATYLSMGTCTSGFGLPGLCGKVHVKVDGVFPLVMGAFYLGGSSGCDGSMKLPIPTPLNPALFQVSFCMQTAILCGGTGQGTGLTNALEFRFGG